ncbi:LysE family translocator [Plantibacter flavus]|uniref:LysE family translocator n=1 Tax=Plantibacter flavus TaxID=150123 RepID=UPI000EAB5A44
MPPAETLWSFALVVGLLTITPGLDTALVLRTAAFTGKRRAWGVIAGIQVGTLVWGALTAIGVTALLTASEVAYDALRLAGAAYLVWIGGRMVRTALRSKRSIAPDARDTESSGGVVSGFVQGLTTNLLNPKMGAFYLALLPQFIPSHAPQLAWGMALTSVHVILGSVWLTTLVLTAQVFRQWLNRRAVATTLDVVAGTAITGFGIRLAVAR